jgi:hypothetical protein
VPQILLPATRPRAAACAVPPRPPIACCWHGVPLTRRLWGSVPPAASLLLPCTAHLHVLNY